MDTNNPLGLSRRTLLAGLGSVGVIGAAGSVGSGLLSDSRRFPRHTLAASNGVDDLLVAWQQWDFPTAGDRRPVNAHPDDDGDGVQSYAGTAYDVARGESALVGASNACRHVSPGAFAVEQDAGDVAFSAVTAVEDRAGETVSDFYGASSGDPNTGFERDGACRMLFYRDGDDRLYLVVVLGAPPARRAGSTVAVDFPGGLPSSGSWVIPPEDGSAGPDGINFRWTGGGAGGAFGPLEPPFQPILADADFTDATDAEWEMLSAGSGESGEPVSIPLAEDRLARLSAHGGIASRNAVPRPEAFRSDVAPEQTALIELSGVVPGDFGEVVFDVRACNTDAYVWLLGTALTESPGTTTEPESKLGDDEANLAESVVLDVRYAVNKDDAWTGDEPAVFGPGVGPYTDFEGDNPATLAAAFDVIGEGSSLDVLDGADAIPLDGDDDTPLDWNEGPAADDRDCLPAGDVLSVRVRWEVPTAVGNEIQGDEAGFTLGFYAEQCENNDPTINESEGAG